jgi:hypothetical protein
MMAVAPVLSAMNGHEKGAEVLLIRLGIAATGK